MNSPTKVQSQQRTHSGRLGGLLAIGTILLLLLGPATPLGATAAPPHERLGSGLARGSALVAESTRSVAPPLPPLSPINPQLLKDLFLKLLIGILQETQAALRVPLQDWLNSPLNFVSQTPPSGTYANGVVVGLWGVVRGAANALLVLVIVVGGLSVMLRDRLGVDYHGALDLLPRVIGGAALANSSLWLAQLAIDTNNALCGLVGGTALPGWQAASTQAQTLVSVVAGLLYLLTALFLILQMLLRLALIDVLIVVAPLALLCWTLPQTHGWARRWASAFSGAVLTQFVQIVALKLGAELFTDLTPASTTADALLPSILGIALLFLAIRIPTLMRGGHGGGGVGRFVLQQSLRSR